MIGVFRVGETPHQNNVELGKHGRNRSNVWTYAGVNSFGAGRDGALAMHPTVKPVALVADAMRDCSFKGDIVLDPFLGSGTSVLAAEKIGRRCFGLEFEPAYVDVTIRRWQSYTKSDAILDGDGRTFDEVAAERLAISSLQSGGEGAGRRRIRHADGSGRAQPRPPRPTVERGAKAMNKPLGPPGSIDYDVGYGRPPESTRFLPGCSGNPRGRPRKRKTVDAIIQESFGQTRSS